MSGLKVALMLVLIAAGIMMMISAVVSLVPYILMIVGAIAIARMLVRQSDRSQLTSIGAEKDETHSPERTRPVNR